MTPYDLAIYRSRRATRWLWAGAVILCLAFGLAFALVARGSQIVQRTNQTLFLAWNPSTNAIGYRLGWGCEPGCVTNWIDVGNTTNSGLVLPRPLPSPSVYVVCHAYSAQDLESVDGNQLWYPGRPVLKVAGTHLQASPSLKQARWTATNSPWCQTNPAGALFFRSADAGGPTVTRGVSYGE